MSQIATLRRSAKEQLQQQRADLHNQQAQLQQTIDQTQALRQELASLPEDTASRIDATMETLRQHLMSLPADTVSRIEPVIETVNRVSHELQQTATQTQALRDQMASFPAETATQLDAKMDTLRDQMSNLAEDTAAHLEPVVQSIDRVSLDLQQTLASTRTEIDRLSKLTTEASKTAENLQKTLKAERHASEKAREKIEKDTAQIAKMQLNRISGITIAAVILIPVLTVILWPTLEPIRQWIGSLL